MSTKVKISNKKMKSDTLLIFPGEIFPLNMGSRRRVFNLLKYFRGLGNNIDLLIITAKIKKISSKVKYDTIATNTFFLESKSLYSFKEKILKVSSLVINKKKEETFIERILRKKNKETIDNCQQLIKKNAYKNIIVSYAWMMWLVEELENRNEINIYCDTYDIQYLRNKSIYKMGRLKSFNFEKEKEKELEYLNKADYIIAISISDYTELRYSYCEKKIILCTIDFDYIRDINFNISEKKKLSINFGFIGSNMISNILSLEKILIQWWPNILKYKKNSNLIIVGDIKKSLRKNTIHMNPSILIEKEITNISDFYQKIDVLLFPNAIKGGLNIKLYEAIFANKIVITDNRYIDEEINQIVRFWSEDTLVNIEFNIHDYKYIENLYQKYFSSRVVYNRLIVCLNR